MWAVHASHGALEPASEHLLGERHRLPDGGGDARRGPGSLGRPAQRLHRDPRAHREGRSRLRCLRREGARPGGFVLPHPPRDNRVFETCRARRCHGRPASRCWRSAGPAAAADDAPHDQFNTTIYGLDDRYRGVKDGRHVVFVHPEDIRPLGLADGDTVDLVGHGATASSGLRRGSGSSPTPAAGLRGRLLPRANLLVPLDWTAEGSNQPASKSMVVRLERPGSPSRRRQPRLGRPGHRVVTHGRAGTRPELAGALSRDEQPPPALAAGGHLLVRRAALVERERARDPGLQLALRGEGEQVGQL